MQGHAVDVERRAEEVLGDAGDEAERAVVGLDEVPVAVDDERGVGVVGLEQLVEGGAHGGHRRIVQRGVVVAGRVAGGEQHRVALT